MSGPHVCGVLILLRTSAVPRDSAVYMFWRFFYRSRRGPMSYAENAGKLRHHPFVCYLVQFVCHHVYQNKL